jgi:hypothetical protein
MAILIADGIASTARTVPWAERTVQRRLRCWTRDVIWPRARQLITGESPMLRRVGGLPMMGTHRNLGSQ